MLKNFFTLKNFATYVVPILSIDIINREDANLKLYFLSSCSL